MKDKEKLKDCFSKENERDITKKSLDWRENSL